MDEIAGLSEIGAAIPARSLGFQVELQAEMGIAVVASGPTNCSILLGLRRQATSVDPMVEIRDLPGLKRET